MKVSEVLQEAQERLKIGGVTDPAREARSLLRLALSREITFIIANPDYELTLAEKHTYLGFVARRASREPFQHISGFQEFWGLDFYVTGDVLIPRPETEMIVEEAINIVRDVENPELCEIGIGSGCISVAILDEIEQATCCGFDVSPKALRIARENAVRHGVSERLDLGISDVFKSIAHEKFDLIVSNPPYVPAEEVAALQTEVRDFDPIIALTDGNDGLSIIERIIKDAPGHLKQGHYLLMEIGFNQSGKVRKMFDLAVWQSVEILPDLQGIPRLVKAQNKTG